MKKNQANKKESAENKNRVPDIPERMKRQDYERELARLHVQLVQLQEWVKSTGAKVWR